MLLVRSHPRRRAQRRAPSSERTESRELLQLAELAARRETNSSAAGGMMRAASSSHSTRGRSSPPKRSRFGRWSTRIEWRSSPRRTTN